MSNGEDLREVYRALRVSQDKYTYFLLAVTGAAIAFSVTQTKDAVLAWEHFPLGVAVLCWASSFFLGIRHLRYVSATLYANASIFVVQQGHHPEVGQHPSRIAAASEGIRQAAESNAEEGNISSRYQLYCLLAGALFFIVWHVLQMWCRAVESGA